MRLVSFETDGAARYGMVIGDGIADLTGKFGAAAPDLKSFLCKPEHVAAAKTTEAAADYRLQDVKLLPPIIDPAHVWCLAINYVDHIDEIKSIGIQREVPKRPAMFMRYADSLVAHGEPIVKPDVSDDLDYEGELAIVIGRGGSRIAEADAMQHVAGYTCFNDGSIRDWQFHTRQIAPGKNFFATGGIGPWIVTADELTDPDNLRIRTILNGTVLQDGSTRHMLFKIPAFIAYASTILPLRPGDILATGTPSGVGFSRKPPIFMKVGDVCDVEIEGIGTLTNPIAAQTPRD